MATFIMLILIVSITVITLLICSCMLSELVSSWLVTFSILCLIRRARSFLTWFVLFFSSEKATALIQSSVHWHLVYGTGLQKDVRNEMQVYMLTGCNVVAGD